VIGDRVGHSLSPLLHNTGFIARKIDAVYLPFLVKDISDFLKAVPVWGIRGFSVTIPYKQSILKHLQDCDPLAAKIGAVNTVVVRRDGSLFGCNTDYIGILRALEKKLRLRGSRVLIFGAGGVARAAAFALAQAGAHVGICARREEAARFSFLLATPITLGAALHKVPHLLGAPNSHIVLLGIVVSGVVGLLAIRVLLAYVRTRDYRPFVYYRWAFAAMLVVVYLVRQARVG